MDDTAQAALKELRELALHANAQKEKEAEETTPPKLERHDTPFGLVNAERFVETGNNYGTPPPPADK